MGMLKDIRKGVSGVCKLISVTTNGCAATETVYFSRSLQKSTSKLDAVGKQIASNLWEGKSPFFGSKKEAENG